MVTPSPLLSMKVENGLSIPLNVSLVQYAEARGLDGVWVSELRARDAFTTMAVYAAASERLTIGSSIVPIYTRSPVSLALAAVSLEDIAPGRIVLGLGTSSATVIEDWHGATRAKPIRAVEEYVTVIREILRGDRADMDGDVVHVRGFRLEFPELAAPGLPIYVAALGGKMREKAAMIADGILLNVVPMSRMGEICESARRAAGEAARPPGSVRLAADLRVALPTATRGAEVVRERQRKYLAYYGNVDAYNHFFSEVGYEDEAARMKEAWERNDPDAAVRSVSDVMLDDIIASGSVDHARNCVERYLASGVDEVILYPCWERGDDIVEATQQVIELAAGLVPSEDPHREAGER